MTILSNFLERTCPCRTASFSELSQSGFITITGVVSGSRDNDAERGNQATFPDCEPCCLANYTLQFPTAQSSFDCAWDNWRSSSVFGGNSRSTAAAGTPLRNSRTSARFWVSTWARARARSIPSSSGSSSPSRCCATLSICRWSTPATTHREQREPIARTCSRSWQVGASGVEVELGPGPDFLEAVVSAAERSYGCQQRTTRFWRYGR